MASKSRWTLWLVLFLAAFLVGCQSSSPPPETTETQPAKGGGKARRAGAKEGGAAAPTVQQITAPAGTALNIVIGEEINTGTTQQGANFDGTLADGLVVNGVEVAAAGSKVSGTVTQVVSSGRLSKPAELSMVLTSLVPTGGDPVQISTSPWGSQGGSHKKRDLEMIGGGGGVGALIGGLVGKKKGALIGGAAGAAAGTGAAAATGKKEIDVPAETKLTFNLSAPATFTVKTM